jgi:precorrin-6B methylase 2
MKTSASYDGFAGAVGSSASGLWPVRRDASLPDRIEQPDTLDDPAETAAFARLVRRAVAQLRPRRVLDVGCGTGLPTIEAARAGAPRVIGIDLAPCNVFVARRNVRSAGLDPSVTVHHARWQDVLDGAFHVGEVDLLVANPPYVPGGEGNAVDGGPRGTRLLDAITERLPASVRGVALLFGSLSDPLHVLAQLERQGLVVTELFGMSVPFGRYTSQPGTLSLLKRLRQQHVAWFCDADAADSNCAPHAYLTLGVLAERRAQPAREGVLTFPESPRALARLLESYQRSGVAALAAYPWLKPL